MSSKKRVSTVLSGTFLIAGTMIGAGMLGIPLVTSQSGFFPGLIITCVVWIFMYATGRLLLEVILWMPDGNNILSLSKRFLGRGGQMIAGSLFIFLYYCLLIAYFAAGAPLLMEGLRWNTSSWIGFSMFGIFFGGVIAIGPRMIDRVNLILSCLMLLVWVFLVSLGSPFVSASHLTYHHFPKMIYAMPVLFSAFGFHNVIPSLATSLQRDKKSLKKASCAVFLTTPIVYPRKVSGLVLLYLSPARATNRAGI